MSLRNFKKIIYAVCVITIATLSYLSFIRKHNNGDSPTNRNAKFLGIKGLEISNGISNQGDLSIDQATPELENSDSNQNNKDSESTSSRPGTLYTVKEGDTYGCIAESYYGSYEHWQDIMNANLKYGNGFSEYGLHVGAVLELPAAETLKPASKLCS